MTSSLQSIERGNRSLRSRDAGVASARIASACFIDVTKHVAGDRWRVAPISLRPQTPLMQRRHYEAALRRRFLLITTTDPWRRDAGRWPARSFWVARKSPAGKIAGGTYLAETHQRPRRGTRFPASRRQRESTLCVARRPRSASNGYAALPGGPPARYRAFQDQSSPCSTRSSPTSRGARFGFFGKPRIRKTGWRAIASRRPLLQASPPSDLHLPPIPSASSAATSRAAPQGSAC